MSKLSILRQAAAWLACAGMALPATSFAAAPRGSESSGSSQPSSSTVLDVRLGTGGVLAGQLRKSDGTPVAGQSVTLANSRQEIVQSTTDTQGNFQFQGVSGGVYSITSSNQTQMCRAWAGDAAPPAANQGILLVQSHDSIVRGQAMDPYNQCAPACQPACQPACGPSCDPCGQPANRCCSPFGFLANPWVIGAAVAVAIAVPLALDDDDDAS